MKKLKILILFLAGTISTAISQTATGVVTQVPCNNDGVYTVNTTGLPLPITYNYYVNGTLIVHPNINSASDQLTNFGMDNSGFIYCQAVSGSSSAWTQTNYTPAFTFQTTAVSPNCPATMGTLTATQTAGTTGPFTFNWTNSQTGLSYPGNNASVPVGFYTLTITDQTSGCVSQISDSIAVTQLSNVTGTINTTPAACTNGTATVTPSGGVSPYTYQWSNGATTASVTGLTAGFYTLTVTDNQGCQSTLWTNIQQNPQISVNTTVTNATCVQNDGSAIAFGSGGVSPYTYTWSNGQTGNTANNLTGGTSYTVIATDANGCTGQGNAYVVSTTPITVTHTTTASQCTSPTGSATLTPTGGAAPYTYVWDGNASLNTATLSNVAAGPHSFVVMDANGCVRTGNVVVPAVSTINAGIQTSNTVCPNVTGTATVNVSGTNSPFTYLWNTGATTSQITGLSSGLYTCVITDNLGCTLTKSATVQTTSPLTVGLSTTPATCLFNQDGTVNVTVNGGLAPYTYSYSNGTTTQNASNLGVGNHTLTVTDANGCGITKFFTITNSNASTSCYCTISGNVYVDANANCVKDPGEAGVENIMIHCSGQGYTFTDANGDYSFQVPTGAYTITEQVNAYYPLAACQNNTTTVNVVAATGCNTVVDFANVINPIHDLKILTVNSFLPPIPGNNYQQMVIVTNDGTITESGVQLGYEHDGQLSFMNSSLSSFMQLNSTGAPNAYSVQTGFPTLSPSGSHTMLLNYSTPTNIPIGTNVVFHDTVADVAPIDASWLLDYSPWNNVNTYNATVIGSYDPNYKEVSPQGIDAPGYISSQVKEFDYTIHFQNEGTYFAQNIYITDQLDADLDWTTLKPGYSEYPYTTTVSETGLVTFTFANINLPWKSAYGDALSSSLISYSIQKKENLPQGTEFTNYADIYFDYNAPITTNTTINTINDEMFNSTEEVSAETTINNGVAMRMYPVPAKDLVTIQVKNVSSKEMGTLIIMDLTGNVVMSDQIELNEGMTIMTQDVSTIANGTYIVQIALENGESVIEKLILN